MNWTWPWICLLPLFSMMLGACSAPKNNDMQANALIHEKSPYLQQHAYNPVDWKPWKAEVLEEAQRNDKLIIVSIGYSACHWCHVMEHESFEDSAVAAIMNEHFVSIKVDREERPDIDQIYMDACMLQHGHGGWPLNAIALPDGRPIYAGTYFPKDKWMEILLFLDDYYRNNRPEAEARAEQFTNMIAVNDIVPLNEQASDFVSDDMAVMWKAFEPRIDFALGGRIGAPKFPMPVNYEYLKQQFAYSKDDRVLRAINVGLTEMAQGGIYDHLAGGFARYSVDERWHVPHFEKMLYDNGQLLSVYSKAYALTGKKLYRETVEQTIEWLLNEMQSPEGAFYSALDADTEGEEGKFYVWQAQEIDALLGDRADLFKSVYQVSDSGNWEHKNILFRSHDFARLAQEYNMPEEELKQQLADMRRRLLEERNKRVRPGLDDKILTAWNALTIKGMVDAYQYLQEERYLSIAQQNYAFLKANCWQVDGRLYRNYKDGNAAIDAFLDDYALLMQAALSLYQVTFDLDYLHDAQQLQAYTYEHFFSAQHGMYYYTNDSAEALIARKMEVHDNVIPSSNSVMANNLLTLAAITSSDSLHAIARQMVVNMEEQTLANPNYNANWAKAVIQLVHPPFEVALTGKKALSHRQAMMGRFLPQAVFIGHSEASEPDLLKGKQDGSSKIYVCQQRVCQLPVEQVDAALQQLDISWD